MIGAIRAMIGVKVVRRARQNRDVSVLLPPPDLPASGLQQWLKTKNITVSTIMMWAKARILEHFFPAPSLRLHALRNRKEEMIGEWLKRENHHRNRQPQRHPQTVTGRRGGIKGQRFQRRAVPLRDVQGQQHQRSDEREYL